MIIKDYITAAERLNLELKTLYDFAGHQCVGCGRTSEEIAMYEGWNDDDFDNNSKTTNSGLWYCHEDCFRDSR